jgi:hypothetical protein
MTVATPSRLVTDADRTDAPTEPVYYRRVNPWDAPRAYAGVAVCLTVSAAFAVSAFDSVRAEWLDVAAGVVGVALVLFVAMSALSTRYARRHPNAFERIAGGVR